MGFLNIKKVKSWVAGHKIVSAIVVLALILGVYKTISANSGNGAARYVFAPVQRGTLATTVSGTGQISAQNQVDIKAKASGDITRIYIKAGQAVKAGDLLAQIDSRNAGVTLESAKVAYEKLVKPADPEDVKTAEDNILESYNNAWSDVSSVFVDYPAIISGMDTLLYSQGGYLGSSNNTRRSVIAKEGIQKAGFSFDQAKTRYAVVLMEYNSLSRLSATTSIKLLVAEVRDMVKIMADALKNTQNAISYIMQSEPDTSAIASTNASNVNGWLSSVNSRLSDLLSDQNSILTNEIALKDLVKGPDALDVRSGQLTLLQSQYNYQDYFIRALFDGVIARVPAKVGDSGSGATIVTIIADKKFATISLNEVDVAKVKIGQKASLTFDAVEDLEVFGEVDEVDLIGTVSQGVVSYNVKATFDTEDVRIKPGMSVNADIVTESKENVLMVPNSAVKTQNGNKYVEISAGMTAAAAASQPVKVETGVSNDTQTEIVSGLKEGDRIVVRTISGTSGASAAQAPNIFGAARSRAGISGPPGSVQIRSAR